MMVVHLLENLAAAGVRIGLEGDQVWYEPREAVSPALRNLLVQHKPELIVYFQQEAAITNAETYDNLPPAMAAEALLGRLKRHGCSIAIDGGELVVTGSLTPELRQAIRDRKTELLLLLSGCAVETVEPPDNDYDYGGERAAIRFADTPGADGPLKQTLGELACLGRHHQPEFWKARGCDNRGWTRTACKTCDKFIGYCPPEKSVKLKNESAVDCSPPPTLT
jgi:hypothetical protein